MSYPKIRALNLPLFVDTFSKFIEIRGEKFSNFTEIKGETFWGKTNLLLFFSCIS